MALSAAHGTGAAALLRAETAPVDELPDGVHVPTQASARGERRPNGTFAKGARTVQAAGVVRPPARARWDCPVLFAVNPVSAGRLMAGLLKRWEERLAGEGGTSRNSAMG
jgi:hypothetical protein